jgi:hypothetical protein
MGYGSWDRRVVVMTAENDGEPLFALREVFYNQDGMPIGHGEPSVMSETMDGLAKLLDHMREALAQPALKPQDFIENKREV